jgi:hypothetical protein
MYLEYYHKSSQTLTRFTSGYPGNFCVYREIKIFPYNFYWQFFYNAVGILHPKEILLCLNSLSSVVISTLCSPIMLLLTSPSTVPYASPFSICPRHSTPVSYLEFCHFSSISKASQSSSSYYFSNVILDIRNFSKF